VQVKVKILRPDEYLRPEMNASVAFLADKKPQTGSAPGQPSIWIPSTAVRDGSVFVIGSGRAVSRKVKTGPTMTLSSGAPGVRVEEGLIGGEDLIVGPPADLKDGDRVKART
jgi:HlyD family secretion protein